LPISGLSVAYTALGGIILWSGIKGETLSQTIQDIVHGQAPSTDQQPIENSSGEALTPASSTDSSSAATTVTGNTGADSATAAANQLIARGLSAPYGWSAGPQWTALVELWNAESGWSNTATNDGQPYNATTVAYGIPQALPATKMGALANPPTNSASAQISWGLSYIKDTYGDPETAWAHEVNEGWY
jgi:hypothetical protein